MPLSTDYIADNIYQDQEMELQPIQKLKVEECGVTTIDQLKRKISMNVINIEFGEMDQQ